MLDFVRKNLDLLSAALDAMPEKVLVLDHTGRVVLTNAAWRSLHQADQRGAAAFGPGETLRSLDILNSEDEDTAAFLANLDRVMIGRSATCTHVCRSTGAGTARWYRLHATRIHLGRWTGVVVTMDDVSDVHRAKQAISRLSLRLNRVQQQERERIALELHDSTAQHLAAASLNLAGLRARVSLSGRDAVTLDDIETSLQTAMREVQVMSFGLYPPRLDEGDLNATLERFLRTYARQTGIRTALHAPALGFAAAETPANALAHHAGSVDERSSPCRRLARLGASADHARKRAALCCRRRQGHGSDRPHRFPDGRDRNWHFRHAGARGSIRRRVAGEVRSRAGYEDPGADSADAPTQQIRPAGAASVLAAYGN